MRSIMSKYWPFVVFVILGSAGGFLYWRFVGCNSGSCPITSNWHLSSFAGGLIGYLGGSSVYDMLGKNNNKNK